MDKNFETDREWQNRHMERQVWLAELRAIAEEVSARTTLTEDEATALIEEVRRVERGGGIAGDHSTHQSRSRR